MTRWIDIGIDIGTVTVQMAAVADEKRAGLISDLFAESGFQVHAFSASGTRVHAPDSVRHYGEPDRYIERLLSPFLNHSGIRNDIRIAVTGNHGRLSRQIPYSSPVNAYRAAALGVAAVYPGVRTIFEIGGSVSKYIHIERDENGIVQIVDYGVNGECAAGTGAFFDQQVKRLRYDIEDVGGVIRQAKRTASIAGRCSVFAKSDMIHAQQRGYQPPEILKGLCEAVVRNFKGSITKGKQIVPPVAFIGGVAANEGVVGAIRQIFGLEGNDLIVPERHDHLAALGAALFSRDRNGNGKTGARRLYSGRKTNDARHQSPAAMPPLSMKNVVLLRDRMPILRMPEQYPVKAFLGLDIGSVSTNLALITPEGALIHGIYRMTEGRPIEVVTAAMREMAGHADGRIQVCGVGTTGSGRELIGALVGADAVKDEITAHKTGALHISRSFLNREVDTIFEIGGQDSKFISLRRGEVVDFSLNEACAAGTGSFLEEQAGQLGISIRDEFARMALRSRNPLNMGERCTVFMEKELTRYLSSHVSKEDMTAGLAYSVVQNYLNRVVKRRFIGETIFFQGGTAYNDSVAAAFASILKREIIVPPHNGIIGAIGAALLASKTMMLYQDNTHFRGWDLSGLEWRRREFQCKGCSNQCLIQEFDVAGDKLYWGDKCSDRYRKQAKSRSVPVIPDLPAMREDLLFHVRAGRKTHRTPKFRGRIGIPRILSFYERLPFWRTYLESMGYEAVLSGPTHQDTVECGIESAVAEPCFPVQAAHGHVLDLAGTTLSFVFIPHILNETDPTGSVASFLCPWAQTVPLVLKHNPFVEKQNFRLLMPTVPFRETPSMVEKMLWREMKVLKVPRYLHQKALARAYQTQQKFRDALQASGSEALEKWMAGGGAAVVIIGRPYNLHDAGLNLGIPGKLRSVYGVDVLPMDFLPLDDIDISDLNRHMFWNYGRRILQAARYAGRYNKLHVIYLSNFKCGPDSYIRHYVEEAAGEPVLFLQLDSHANDAGIMTRIEAFLESKGML